MTDFFQQDLAILADGDCPSDWERDDLLLFAQNLAKRLVAIRDIASRSRRMTDDFPALDEIRSIAMGGKAP